MLKILKLYIVTFVFIITLVHHLTESRLRVNFTRMGTQATFKITKTEKKEGVFYGIYVPAYLSPTGVAKKMLFKKKIDAEKKRAELIAATRTESRETVLSNHQLVDARRALERLAEAGVSISLDRAIELALPLLKASGGQITVAQLLTDFMTLKQASWRPHTTKNFRQAAKLMCQKLGEIRLTEVNAHMLNEWLTSCNEKAAYQAGLVRTLRPAFSYAVRQGMLPESPFSRMEPIRVPVRSGVDVLTPYEAAVLMRAAPADCKAAFALLLFAGVRPQELMKLRWGDIRDGYVHITPEVAKTSQVRNIEIEPNLEEWLDAYGFHSPDALVCPPNWKRKAQITRRITRLGNRQDVARHSYATYHLAKYRDRATLEVNMGHSVGSAMLFRHYRAAATPEQAEEYWNIRPE